MLYCKYCYAYISSTLLVPINCKSCKNSLDMPQDILECTDEQAVSILRIHKKTKILSHLIPTILTFQVVFIAFFVEWFNKNTKVTFLISSAPSWVFFLFFFVAIFLININISVIIERAIWGFIACLSAIILYCGFQDMKSSPLNTSTDATLYLCLGIAVVFMSIIWACVLRFYTPFTLFFKRGLLSRARASFLFFFSFIFLYGLNLLLQHFLF